MNNSQMYDNLTFNFLFHFLSWKGDTFSTNCLLLSNEVSSTGTALHLTGLLTKEVSWEPPNNPGCCLDNTYTAH